MLGWVVRTGESTESFSMHEKELEDLPWRESKRLAGKPDKAASLATADGDVTPNVRAKLPAEAGFVSPD
jgi:hypothetical protein